MGTAGSVDGGNKSPNNQSSGAPARSGQQSPGLNTSDSGSKGLSGSDAKKSPTTSPSQPNIRTPNAKGHRRTPSQNSQGASEEERRQRRAELGLDDDGDDCVKISPPPGATSTTPKGKKKTKVVVKTKRIVRKVVSKSGVTGGAGGDAHPERLPLLERGETVNSWKKGQVIGKGATGAVYQAIEESTGKYFCVKEIEFAEDFAENPQDRARFELLRAEIAVLQEVDHPNVVRFIGVDKIGFSMYIMMELVAGGTLSEIIKQFGALSDAKACEFTRQIAEGLVYLHDKNIIHRDIKGANILVGIDGSVKLADFGAAKRILDPEVLFKTLAGTPYWMAPEVVRQEGHGKPADVWSLGATVLQMLTGLAPYQSLQPVPALFKIGHGKDSPVPANLNANPLVVDFVSLCLQRNAADRPTVRDLLAHPWLQSSSGWQPSQFMSTSGSEDSKPANYATPNAVARRQLLQNSCASETDEIREFIIHMSFARALEDDDMVENAGPAGEAVNGTTSPEEEAPFDEDQFAQFMENLQHDDEDGETSH